MAVLKYKNGQGEFVTLTNYTVQPITPVQTTGNSLSDIMSQDAVTRGLNKKANATDVYAKSAVDEALALKANASDVYTKAQTDSALAGKADSNQVYTKSEVESALAGKANSDNVYSKEEVNGALAEKANADDVYTKAETDGAITAATESLKEEIVSGTIELNNYYTKQQADEKFVDKNNLDAISGQLATEIEKIINVENVENIVTTENLNETLSGYATTQYVDNAISGIEQGGTFITTANVETILTEKEFVTSATVETQISEATAGYFDYVDYDDEASRIVFKHGGEAGTEVGYVNASEFLKDGMISSAYVENNELVIEFKTGEGGTDAVRIPLSDIFDANNYYTKSQTDGKFLTLTGASATYLTQEAAGNTYLTKTDAGNTYLTQTGASATYLTQEAAGNTYLTIESASTTYVTNEGFDEKVGDAIGESQEVIGAVAGIVETYLNEHDVMTSASTSGMIDTALVDYYKKSETSSKTEIDNALALKLDTETFNTEKASFATTGGVQSMITDSLTGYTPTDGLATVINNTIYGTGYTPTPGASAVTSDNLDDLLTGDAAVSGAVINVFTSSTVYNTMNENISSALTDAASALSAANSAKAVTDFYEGHNDVTSLANLPNDKRLIIATINDNAGNLNITGDTLSDGREIHVIINNTGSETITISLSNTDKYKLVGSDSIAIESGKYGEVNLIAAYDSANNQTVFYVRGV